MRRNLIVICPHQAELGCSLEAIYRRIIVINWHYLTMLTIASGKRWWMGSSFTMLLHHFIANCEVMLVINTDTHLTVQTIQGDLRVLHKSGGCHPSQGKWQLLPPRASLQDAFVKLSVKASSYKYRLTNERCRSQTNRSSKAISSTSYYIIAKTTLNQHIQ